MGHEDDSETPEAASTEAVQRTVTVYGASDDLIELEGDIEEEFSYYEGRHYVYFSNGTVLEVTFDDDGIWRIVPQHHGIGTVAIAQVVPGGEAYSDIAYVSGDIAWAGTGDRLVRANV